MSWLRLACVDPYGEEKWVRETVRDLGLEQPVLRPRKHALRGGDASQLAAILEIHNTGLSLTLLSADRELNAAAVAEGITVDDANCPIRLSSPERLPKSTNPIEFIDIGLDGPYSPGNNHIPEDGAVVLIERAEQQRVRGGDGSRDFVLSTRQRETR